MKQISFLLIIFLASCVSIKDEHNNKLHSKYQMYLTEINKNNIRQLFTKYFSVDLLGTESINDPEITDQLLFKKYMNTYYNHIEKTSNNKGCLTINGFDDENEPVAFNLEYILYNGKWLINDIHILFLDYKSKFSEVARCPSYYVNNANN